MATMLAHEVTSYRQTDRELNDRNGTNTVNSAPTAG